MSALRSWLPTLLGCFALMTFAAGCSDCGGSSTTSDAGDGDGSDVACSLDTDCNDDNDCTVDSCQNAVCVNSPAPGGTECDDGLACTTDDRCTSGVCKGDAPVECDDGNPCTDDSCDEDGCTNLANTETCDDGLFCTVDDVCDGLGTCSGQARDCSVSDDVCLVGTCDEASQACGQIPSDDGTACDDQNACASVDACLAGVCEPGPTDLDADIDGFFDAACPDGDDCDDGDETINPDANEGPAGEPTCSDEIDNDCDGLTDMADDCGDCQTDSDCDDGLACTTGACVAGACIFSPDDLACDDGNECSADVCDLNLGCVNEALTDGTACGDPNALECTAPDTCLSGVCQPNNEVLGTACGDQGVICLADDVCDGLGNCADAGFAPNNSPCADGLYCNGAETCDGGGSCQTSSDPCGALMCDEDNDQCVGCMADADCPSCQSCDAGNCVDQAVGLDLRDECDPGICLTGACDGAGACGYEAVDTACGDANDDACTNPDTCNGFGACLDNHAASGDACGDQGVACLVDDTCDGAGACVDNGPVANGTTCGDVTDDACTNPDSCDGAGACLANDAGAGAPCGDQGVECLTDDTCDGVGSCQDNGLAADGSVCGDGTDDACTNPDACLAGACQANHESVGAACGDQGVVCQLDDACDGAGACVDNGPAANGNACGDPTVDACTAADSCDGAGTCLANDAAIGAACGDQGVACLVDDACDGSGSCVDSGFESAGIACGDATDDECTNPDACDGAGTCSDNHLGAGAPCGDQGVACLVDDACDGNGSCSDNGSQADGSVCGDGNDDACDNPDSCLAGACQNNFEAAGAACGDQGLDCLVDDACDGAGACQDNGSAADGTACGDPADTECSDPDSCTAGVCQPNEAAAGSACGDQGVVCLVDDACDGAGACVNNGFESNGTACGDPTDDECTNPDACDGAGICLANHAGAGAACGDQATACLVDDSCDGAGACQDNGFQADGSACGNATDDACTNPDSCASGACQANHEAAGSACGDQGVDCLADDSCDGAGACQDNGFQADGSACGNATDDACTNPDSCSSGACQVNHEAAGSACGDQGLECLVDDACDGSGSCVDNGFSGAGAPCPDSTYCNGAETCDGAGVCNSPGDPCGGLLCDEPNDQCVGCFDDEDCPGCQLCNGGNCENQLAGDDSKDDCAAGTCLTGACDGSGSCGFTSNGSACGDASDDDCTNPDSCDGAGTCLANDAGAGAACGDQGLECLADDACDGSGSCVDNGNLANGSACGNPGDTDCTNPDTCIAGACLPNNAAAGAACGDPANTECTNPDSCDGAGACLVNHTAAGAACGDQGVECLVDDACDGAGACQNNGPEAGGTACGSPADTECTNPDSCDGSGSCLDNDAGSGAACGDQGVACLVDDTCDGAGACQDNGNEADASACGDPGDDECTNPDSCQAGACQPNHESAGAACGDQGVACLVDDTCDGSGACQDNGNQANGSPCGDPSDNECTNPDNCQAGACQDNHEGAGAACGDQGVECLVDDACDGSGACQNNGPESFGTTCGDATDDACTNPDSCDGSGSCLDNDASAGAACGDQGVECLVDDACDGAGACQDNGNEANGTPCGLPTDDECTNPDSCQAGACLDNHEAAGAACGDQGVDCLVDDSCDGSGGCQNNGIESNGTPCGLATDNDCTNPDSCQAGACLDNNEAAGAACGDQGVDCLVDDTCDGAGACQDNSFEANGTPCGSASATACTNPDSCDGAGSCLSNDAGAGAPCDDQGIDCLVDDTCDGSGSCSDNGFESNGSACGDPGNTVCTNSDTCSAGACQDNHTAAGAACGDQGVECLVDDVCDGAGACSDSGFESDGSSCGDLSNADCTNPDTCLAGACHDNHAAAGAACGDQGVECLVDDTCDGAGGCSDNGLEANGTACNDANACTVGDTCTDGACIGTIRDQDGDTYGDKLCGADDCNDSDFDINPGVSETCGDAVDNDCDELTDEGCASCGVVDPTAELRIDNDEPNSSYPLVTDDEVLNVYVAGAEGYNIIEVQAFFWDFSGGAGTLQGDYSVHIYADQGGLPGPEIGSSPTVTVSAVHPAAHTFSLSAMVSLSQGDVFWVGVRFDEDQDTNLFLPLRDYGMLNPYLGGFIYILADDDYYYAPGNWMIRPQGCAEGPWLELTAHSSIPANVLAGNTGTVSTSLSNRGYGDTGAVLGTLACAEPTLTVTQASGSYGVISPAATAANAPAYQVSADPAAFGIYSMELDSTDGPNSWLDGFGLYVQGTGCGVDNRTLATDNGPAVFFTPTDGDEFGNYFVVDAASFTMTDVEVQYYRTDGPASSRFRVKVYTYRAGYPDQILWTSNWVAVSGTNVITQTFSLGTPLTFRQGNTFWVTTESESDLTGNDFGILADDGDTDNGSWANGVVWDNALSAWGIVYRSMVIRPHGCEATNLRYDSHAAAPALPSPGATTDLTVTIANDGATDATNVSTTLSSADPDVTVLTASANYGTVSAGGTAASQTDYQVRIEAFADDQQYMLDLQITDGVNTWNDQFPIRVAGGAVDLAFSDFTTNLVGNDIHYQFVATNQGTWDCITPFQVDLYVDEENPPIPQQAGDWSDSPTGLPVGASLTYDLVLADVTPGDYDAYVQVDTLETVIESSEANNINGPSSQTVGTTDVFELLDPERKWFPADMPVLYRFVTGNSQPGLTQAEARDACRAGFQHWEDVPNASINFGEEAETGVDGFVNDGHNTLSFNDPDGDLGTGTLAGNLPIYTTGQSMWTNGVRFYRMTDADTVFNNNINFGTNAEAAAGGCVNTTDIEGVATHEFGHALGLDHPNVANATMYYAIGACDASKVTLEISDINGITFIYP